jgi:hypothetical protein
MILIVLFLLALLLLPTFFGYKCSTREEFKKAFWIQGGALLLLLLAFLLFESFFGARDPYGVRVLGYLFYGVPPALVWSGFSLGLCIRFFQVKEPSTASLRPMVFILGTVSMLVPIGFFALLILLNM